MLQYLVILLDDTSVSFCHAINPAKNKRLMPLDVLHDAIFFAMKHNLMVQYVLPPYQLPVEYYHEMDSIDNVKIGLDVSVFNCIPNSINTDTVVLSISRELFIENIYMVSKILRNAKRICVNFTNIESYKDELNEKYEETLNILKDTIIEELLKGKRHELNLITDRLCLSKMANCNAGVNNITIAPNGKFYICPAFYYDEIQLVDTGLSYKSPIYDRSVGDLKSGLSVKNEQLFQIEKSPLCKDCDAFHCNRCLWLNQKLTFEINTPSHEQCVMSHIERRVTKSLSESFRNMGFESPIINDVDYLDPFEKTI